MFFRTQSRAAIWSSRQPLGASIYEKARARRIGHAHAVRVLARAWIRAIWRCWHDHTRYDPGAISLLCGPFRPARIMRPAPPKLHRRHRDRARIAYLESPAGVASVASSCSVGGRVGCGPRAGHWFQ